MSRKLLAAVLAACLALVACSAPARPKRVVAEQPLARIDPAAPPLQPCPMQASPDGRRLAYAAGWGDRRFMVVDGEEGSRGNAVVNPPIFSPNSQRLAYVIVEGKTWSVVVDGQRQAEYAQVVPGSVTFSPGSEHIAYAVRQDRKMRGVVDGSVGREYEAIVAASQRIGLEQSAPTRGQGIVFDSTNAFHYLALRDRVVYLPEERFE